jgi:hypothetical protein
VGDRLYALEAGAGCSHGLKGTVNSVLRVDGSGRTSQLANLSEFVMSHPVARPNPADFEPDGTWYSMVAEGDRLEVVEPNHGEVDTVSARDGTISRLVDVSASQGHIVPTSLVRFEGGFLLGNLGQFVPNDPVPVGVRRLARGGAISPVASGLTAVTGVAAEHGQIYALEAFTGFFAPTQESRTLWHRSTRNCFPGPTMRRGLTGRRTSADAAGAGLTRPADRSPAAREADVCRARG